MVEEQECRDDVEEEGRDGDVKEKEEGRDGDVEEEEGSRCGGSGQGW